MYRPIDPTDPSQGFVAVFMGSLFGTVGFDPTGADHPRCCHESWVRGMIIGRGAGGMEDCEICVTYDGSFESLDDLDLCRENDIKWDLRLDGTVCCPCPDRVEDKEHYQKE